MIGFRDDIVAVWESYTTSLRSIHVRISGKEDNLIGQKSMTGEYTPKTTYKAFYLGDVVGDLLWW